MQPNGTAGYAAETLQADVDAELSVTTVIGTNLRVRFAGGDARTLNAGRDDDVAPHREEFPLQHDSRPTNF
jgi:hypothetical protein